MFTRISVSLKEEENLALRELAQKERRRPEAQAAWIIRLELERCGLLLPDIADSEKVDHGE